MESLTSEFLAKRRTTTTKKKKKSQKEPWPKKKGGVALEGYLEPTDSGSSSGSDSSSSSSSSGELQLVGRTKSLTEEDLEELKGCLDLGFGFSYDEIPELCTTLPALELCYSMAQRFLLDDHQRSPPEYSTAADHAPPAPPLPNWNFSSPGDDPEEVKARLKYWAQTVACTVRLCS